MRHHFTKGTVEASIWCTSCYSFTMHTIADGRPQFCQVCQAKVVPKKAAARSRCGDLFAEDPPEAETLS